MTHPSQIIPADRSPDRAWDYGNWYKLSLVRDWDSRSVKATARIVTAFPITHWKFSSFESSLGLFQFRQFRKD